jgi:crotonobetainyl-CoA:carnitine CoA-transferase CaiB-like acyl-CoA transferase
MEESAPDGGDGAMNPPLAGVSVLDLSIWRPGPYATSLLGGLGADVLKVEPPGGDPMRHYAGLFEEVNRGKRSVMLDLTADVDRERAWSLATQADVIVEGFRPGVLGRFGLDAASVRAAHPRVVYCSISGYGQQGALASLPGHDVNYQAWAGSLAPEGGKASMPPLPVADLASGMTAAFGICAALLGRGAAGPGSYLDVSMTDVMATWTGAASAADEPRAAAPSVPGYGLFTTRDGGQVALGVVNEQHFWSALSHELGLPELADIPFDQRMARGEELMDTVRTAIGERQRDELVDALLRAGAPVAPVHDRRAMMAYSPVPPFPIRLDAAGSTAPAPALDQHRGQGFANS